MGDNNDDKSWFEALAPLLIFYFSGMFLYVVFWDAGNGKSGLRICVEGVFKLSLVFGALSVACALIVIGVAIVDAMPRWAIYALCSIPLCLLAYLSHHTFRKFLSERQKQKVIGAKRHEDSAWLVHYLEAEFPLLAEAEREKVKCQLIGVDGIDAFRHQLDMEYRLRLISRIQPKELVCWLDELTEGQKCTRRLEWERKRQAQSEAQLSINAEKKAARLVATPPVQPTQAQIEARENAKQAKRDARAKLKKESDEQHDKEMRMRGLTAKAAYKSKW